MEGSGIDIKDCFVAYIIIKLSNYFVESYKQKSRDESEFDRQIAGADRRFMSKGTDFGKSKHPTKILTSINTSSNSISGFENSQALLYIDCLCPFHYLF